MGLSGSAGRLNRAARRSSGSSSGNSSGGGGVYQQLMESGATDYGTAYQMLRAAGYGTTDANRYASYFADTYYPNYSSGSSKRTSLNWDQDEGVFTWNGQNYIDPDELISDIEAANLSNAEKRKLQEKFSLFGFDLSF